MTCHHKNKDKVTIIELREQYNGKLAVILRTRIECRQAGCADQISKDKVERLK